MNEEQIKKSGILSPGLVDGHVTNFLATSNGQYWLKRVGQDGYQKDADGKLLCIPLASVLHARHEYLTLHYEEEIQRAIEREISKLGGELVEKATKVIDFISQQQGWVSATKSTGQKLKEAILRQHDPAVAEHKEQVAKTFFADNPTALAFAEALAKYIIEANYEALYQALTPAGEPIAVFKHHDPAMSRIFGRLAPERYHH